LLVSSIAKFDPLLALDLTVLHLVTNSWTL